MIGQTLFPIGEIKRNSLGSGVGKHAVACADNLEFMAKFPDQSFQLIVTSPPYNIGKEYERRDSLTCYLETQERVISHCVRLLKPAGSICWQVGNHITADGEVVPLDIMFHPIFKKLGMKLRNRIIWHFEHGLHCTRRFSGRYETILWFTKSDQFVFDVDPIRIPPKYPGKKYFKGPKAGMFSCNPLGKNPGDVWVIPNVKANHVEKTIHPCQFPVELVERLVLSMTRAGDGVFDPYMGVGSAVIAAIKNNRDGYGCDIEEKYVKIARARIADYRTGVLQTRPMERPVYDPTLPNGGHR